MPSINKHLILLLLASCLPIGLVYGADLNTGSFTKMQKQGKTLQTSYSTANKDLVTVKKNFSKVKTLTFMPKVYLSGYSGTGSYIVGQADILAPVLLRYDRIVYVYAKGRYGFEKESWEKNTWHGALGVGYRQIQGNARILGGYLLGDYTSFTNGKTVIVANPGLESLGKIWDFHLNGYLPVGTTSWTESGWADTFGNYDYVKYKGRDKYDAWFTYYEATGMGADTEIGRNLFTVENVLFKGYIGGYVFGMKNNDNMYGGEVKLTAALSQAIKLTATDTYDNYNHNVVMGGLELSINNLINGNIFQPVDPQDIQTRLFDKIDNNLSTIGSGSAVPMVGGPNNGKPEINIFQLEEDNDWWFNTDKSANSANSNNRNPEIGPDNGRYDSPIAGEDFNQAILKQIEQYCREHGWGSPHIYFASGTNYNKQNNLNGQINLHGQFELYNGLSIGGGWDMDNNKPTIGNARPLLIGSLKLDGNQNLGYIQLQNDPTNYQDTAITMDNANNVVINNVAIGANDPVHSYMTGIAMTNGGSLTVKGSSIIAISKGDIQLNDNSGNAYGIHADGKGETINISNSHITGQSLGGNGYDSGNGYGILIGENFINPNNNDSLISNNTLTVSASTITGIGHLNSGNIHKNYYNSGNGYGILVGFGRVSDNNTEKSNINANIQNNDISIKNNSTISGTGNIVAIEPNDRTLNGSVNGYGVMLGYNEWDVKYTSQDSMQIINNNFTIDNSKISGQTGGDATLLNNENNQVSGNSFGVMIGFGLQHPRDNGNPMTPPDYNTCLQNNNLTIENNSEIDSVVNTKQPAKGTIKNINNNSIGVMLGDVTGDIIRVHSEPSLIGNTIAINNTNIGAIFQNPGKSLNANAANMAIGFIFGNQDSATYDPQKNNFNNIFSLSNINIKLSAHYLTAYGIFIPSPAGIKNFSLMGYNITRDPGYHHGEKIATTFQTPYDAVWP